MKNSTIIKNMRKSSFTILIILLAILINNLTLAQENPAQEKDGFEKINNTKNNKINTTTKENSREQLKGFELEIPQTNKFKTTNVMQSKQEVDEENVNVIIIIKNPENVWSESELSKYKDKKQEIKNAMKEYIFENAKLKKTTNFSTFQGFSTTISQSELNKIKDNPLVQRIDKNVKFKSQLTQSTHIIGASTVHNYNAPTSVKLTGLTGRDQTVCVLDTGINYEHESLGGEWGVKVITGHKFLGNGTNTQSCDENNSACMDDSTKQHGTHVAGIISANKTITGIAPESKLAALNVLGQNSNDDTGYMVDVISGIEWCINNSEKYNISTISMSMGSDELYDDYCDADYYALSQSINNATSKNITVIAATGNDGENRISAPACIENVIRVGSVNKNKELSDYNLWKKDLILAPGENINSTINTTSYKSKSGTSMATPHVAGAIAILNQYYHTINESKTPQELFNLLHDAGDEIAKDNETYKLINLEKTMNYVLGINATIHSPLSKNYNYENITINLTLQNDAHKTSYSYYNETRNYTKPTNITFREGLVNLSINVTDEYNNTNTQKIQFYVDLMKPIIEIENPTNNIYNHTTHKLIINASDERGIKSLQYTINETTKNYTAPINLTFPEGNHTIYARAEDLAGNINYTNTSFIVDTPPKINITTPQNKTYNETKLLLNITTKDAHINKTWYNYNGTNETYTAPINLTFKDGLHTIIAWTRDSINQTTKTNTTLLVDTTPPKINITTPQNKTYNTINMLLNIDVQDLTPNTTWYEYNNTNETYTAPINLTFNEGQHIIRVWANDSMKHVNNTNTSFRVDTKKPDINITYPEKNDKIENNKPTIELKVEDASNTIMCELKISDETIKFNVTDNENKQIDLQKELEHGNQKFIITCLDDAGNTKTENSQFEVIKKRTQKTSKNPRSTTYSSQSLEDESKNETTNNTNSTTTTNSTNDEDHTTTTENDKTTNNTIKQEKENELTKNTKTNTAPNNINTQNLFITQEQHELPKNINKTNIENARNKTLNEKINTNTVFIAPIILIILIIITLIILTYQGKFKNKN